MKKFFLTENEFYSSFPFENYDSSDYEQYLLQTEHEWENYIDWLDNAFDEEIEGLLPRDNKKLGTNLKTIRKSERLTQQDLANELNVTTKTISNYESGTFQIPVHVLKELSKLFKVTILSIAGASNKREEALKVFEYSCNADKFELPREVLKKDIVNELALLSPQDLSTLHMFTMSLKAKRILNEN